MPLFDDLDRLVWREKRECEVVGREDGEEGVFVFNWRESLPPKVVGVDGAGEAHASPPPFRERVDPDRERLAVWIDSVSRPRVLGRGLGARDGFALVARLCAYELKALGVENGG